MARSSPPSVARLEASLSANMHALMKYAAELQDQSITDFIVSAAQEAAQRVINEKGIMRLEPADQKCFAEALLAPPEPNPALQKAFDRRKTLLLNLTG